MVDEKAPPRKQGLHGWRAAVAVFGCGSLAGLAVFGLVVAIFGTFLSALSSGFETEAPPGGGAVAARPSAPRDEFREEDFDLCEIIDSISSIQLSLTSGSESPRDESIGGGPPGSDDLVRSGSCGGIVRPEATYVVPWEFDFTYRAVIYSPEDDRDELAEVDLQDWLADAEGAEFAVEESGRFDMVDEAYYFYGVPESGMGNAFSVLGRKRSGIFMINLTAEDGASVAEFSYEIMKLDSRLDNDLGSMIPG
ncbi:hypothetical protein Q8791_11420 [Nocardiopsis sp. CT-R113]|uniref:Uncharacterized protein n=1 Tax=Nocardiopsis codii TaxID=3065942 RepID=A0ABU7K6F5_9ACTN|nr:hypothetical protein [Nocardiopsis sp. CT-R113]MEE2037828.1 hypothetical protein [Nocardiopsis sp. CT-R113]